MKKILAIFSILYFSSVATLKGVIFVGIAKIPCLARVIRNVKFKVAFAYFYMLMNPAFSEIIEIKGLYRDLGELKILWPCENPLPHLVVPAEGLEERDRNRIIYMKSGFVTLAAEINDEARETMSGTIIAYQLLEADGEYGNCHI